MDFLVSPENFGDVTDYLDERRVKYKVSSFKQITTTVRVMDTKNIFLHGHVLNISWKHIFFRKRACTVISCLLQMQIYLDDFIVLLLPSSLFCTGSSGIPQFRLSRFLPFPAVHPTACETDKKTRLFLLRFFRDRYFFLPPFLFDGGRRKIQACPICTAVASERRKEEQLF